MLNTSDTPTPSAQPRSTAGHGTRSESSCGISSGYTPANQRRHRRAEQRTQEASSVYSVSPARVLRAEAAPLPVPDAQALAADRQVIADR